MARVDTRVSFVQNSREFREKMSLVSRNFVLFGECYVSRVCVVSGFVFGE